MTALGALLTGAIVGTVALSRPEWTSPHHLQIGIPIVLTLGLAAYGGWLVQSDLSPKRIRRIALWSLAGAVLLGTFAGWEMYIHLLEGEPFVETVHELLLGMAEGGAVGGVVGYYDARRRDQYLEAEQAQQAISASMDGIAVLDEDGEYQTVNRAHADIYGYDSPDAFIGETWNRCYTDEEATRIEEELLPQLHEEGSWRGELTGQRRDGSTFPQEITLSVRPNGGMVCVVRDITERKTQENRLRVLHDVTREFLAAETPDAIATEMVSVADDMLGYPLTAIWEYDSDADQLVPLTASEPAREFAARAGLAELPVLEAGSAEMNMFREGEAVLVEDYQTLENRQATEVPLGAVLFIPFGERGLMGIGEAEPAAIDSTDRFLAEILVANATAAIDRIEREQELAQREHRLRTIVENAPVVLFAIDQDRELTLQVGKGLNRAGVEQNQMVGGTVDDLFGDSPAVLDAVDRCLDGESVDVTVDVWGRTYQVWYEPIEGGGDVTTAIGVAIDVTERQRRERGITSGDRPSRCIRNSVCQVTVSTSQRRSGSIISNGMNTTPITATARESTRNESRPFQSRIPTYADIGTATALPTPSTIDFCTNTKCGSWTSQKTANSTHAPTLSRRASGREWKSAAHPARNAATTTQASGSATAS